MLDVYWGSISKARYKYADVTDSTEELVHIKTFLLFTLLGILSLAPLSVSAQIINGAVGDNIQPSDIKGEIRIVGCHPKQEELTLFLSNSMANVRISVGDIFLSGEDWNKTSTKTVKIVLVSLDLEKCEGEFEFFY